MIPHDSFLIFTSNLSSALQMTSLLLGFPMKICKFYCPFLHAWSHINNAGSLLHSHYSSHQAFLQKKKSHLAIPQQLHQLIVCNRSNVHPRTGHEGPEGEQMYSTTLHSTSALEGVGGQRHAPAALPPG